MTNFSPAQNLAYEYNASVAFAWWWRVSSGWLSEPGSMSRP